MPIFTASSDSVMSCGVWSKLTGYQASSKQHCRINETQRSTSQTRQTSMHRSTGLSHAQKLSTPETPTNGNNRRSSVLTALTTAPSSYKRHGKCISNAASNAKKQMICPSIEAEQKRALVGILQHYRCRRD